MGNYRLDTKFYMIFLNFFGGVQTKVTRLQFFAYNLLKFQLYIYMFSSKHYAKTLSPYIVTAAIALCELRDG